MTNKEIIIDVRNYDPNSDYEWVYYLYNDWSTFWGQYDDARDTEERMQLLSKNNPSKILVAVVDNKIVWTVTLFEDGRSARLYRFAIQKIHENEISIALYNEAKKILKELWHNQVLVYAPDSSQYENRYKLLWFTKWNIYRDYWEDI